MITVYLVGPLFTEADQVHLRLGTACGSATAFSLGLATKEKIEELFGQI